MNNCHMFHNNCQTIAINKLIAAIKYTLKIYSITHGLPLLLFKRKDLKNQPVKTLRKYIISVFKSMGFLITYIMSIRLFHCLVFSRLKLFSSKF